MKNYQDLAELVSDFLLENDVSEAVLEKRSGGEIKQGYINLIKNRKVDTLNITLKKLRALARSMRKSEALIIDLARGSNKEITFTKQFEDLFSTLPENRQSDLIKFAEVFYEEVLKKDSDEKITFKPNYEEEKEDSEQTKKNLKVKKAL